MVKIPMNTYEVDTTVREEIVQGICDAFLDGNSWSAYHPFRDGVRQASSMIIRRSDGDKYYGFLDHAFTRETGTPFTASEMAEAVRAIVAAGYHIIKSMDYGSWEAYRVSRRPPNPHETEVTAVPYVV